MHKNLYGNKALAYLQKPAANGLNHAQIQLSKSGLGLKIFDAYRPYSVTIKMWKPIKNEDYVANPSKGSGHNRGTAVDVTLIDLRTGKELNMGTGFDNFTDSAHHNFTGLHDTILIYRKLLKDVMEENGFKALPTEWWHYSLAGTNDFKLLNLSFKALHKLE